MLKRGSQRESLGKVVLGTARGDIHDIGKNLVATILSASGFQIFDLGTSVTPDQFVAKAKEVDAGRVVGKPPPMSMIMHVQCSGHELFAVAAGHGSGWDAA